MTVYRVTILHDACTTHDVDADTEADAIGEAMGQASVSLCHHCSDSVEMGDPIRAACVENLDTGGSNPEADPDFEVVQLRTRVAELVAALDEAQADAARYAWLKTRALDAGDDVKETPWCVVGTCYEDSQPIDGNRMDAAIDAARAGEKP